MSNGNSAEASTSPSPAPSSIGNNAPKFGTLVPNRVFVGGISATTTEQDLLELFAKYGKVKATKVISDRAGVSKGYGFVTFETEEEARKLTQEGDNIMLKDRKLNIAPAIKKQVTDLGYIKPYSPRLVDGNASATVLGTNGTVFFGNGASYAYTSPMPVLSPTEYHQAVGPVPTPPNAHPTYPQLSQAGTPTAVTASNQVGVSPASAATGYPTQFVYPQTMYLPQQYQHYQAAPIQPQWAAATPQWRWVTPGAYGQPESSALNGETSDQSCLKGTQSSRLPLLSPPFTFSSPFPCDHYGIFSCPPPPLLSNIHSTYLSSSPPPSTYTTTVTSPFSYDPGAASVTTNTSTTTIAVIGSGSMVTSAASEPFGSTVLSSTSEQLGSRVLGNSTDAFGEGSLQIKSLPEVLENTTSGSCFGSYEGSQTSSNGDTFLPKNAFLSMPTATSAAGRRGRTKRLSRVLQSSSESSSSLEDVTRTSLNHNSSVIDGYSHLRQLTNSFRTHTSFGLSDGDILKPKLSNPSSESATTSRGTKTSISPRIPGVQTYGIHPLPHTSSASSVRQIFPIATPFPMCCPQHSLGCHMIQSHPTVAFPIWSPISNLGHGQTIPVETDGLNLAKNRPTAGIPHSSIGSPTSLTGSPQSNCSPPPVTSTFRKAGKSLENSLLGHPVLKMEKSLTPHSIPRVRSSLAMMPPASPSPMVMVPCFQCGPVMNAPWCHWSPPMPQIMNTSRFEMPTSPHAPSCSTHPTTPTASVMPLLIRYTTSNPSVDNVFQFSPYLKTCHDPKTDGSSLSKDVLSMNRPMENAGGAVGDIFIKLKDYLPMNSLSIPHVTTQESFRNPSLPFLGEPIRGMRRLTQHPDDRCALLPISPPLTPVHTPYVTKPLNK